MKNSIKFIGVLSLFVFNWSLLQAQNLMWARSLGGNVADLARSLAVDPVGNVFYVGTYEGIVDFDPGPGTYTLSSAGAVDVFVAKLDPSGNFLWARSIGGTFTDAAFSIALDASSNAYIAGSFLGTIDFDPGPGINTMTSVASSYDAFLLKLDASGNFLWSRSFGNADSDHGFALTSNSSGDVFMTGYFNQTVDFNPGIGTYTLSAGIVDDIYVVHLNSTGNFVWARAVGGADVDTGYGIALDALGNVLVTGSYNSTVDFDPGAGVYTLTSNGNSDVYILKLNSSGNFLWARSFGGTSNDEARSIACDASNNVITTGFFELGVDFDPGPGLSFLNSSGVLDAFLSKLDAGGNLIWAINTGGTGNDAGYGVCVDAGSNIYNSGYFSSNVDFDPSMNTYTSSSVGAGDVYVDRFDASGNFVWARTFGGTGNDQAYAIATNSTNNIHTCGNYQLIADFDPNAGVTNLTSNGSEDLFVHKMCQLPLNVGAINGSTVICVGKIGTYSVTAVSGASSYSWNLPAGWSGSSTSSSISATPGSNGLFTVSAGNSCGYSAPQNLSVSVNPLPSVGISGTNTLCLGAVISLTANGANIYSWSTGATVAIVALNPTITTSYTVTGTSTLTSCSNTAVTTLSVVTCVGVQENIASLEQFKLYPNPSNGEFIIVMIEPAVMKIEVYDISGKMVFNSDLSKSDLKLNLKHLNKGIYFCKLIRNNEISTMKIIIE